MNYLIFSDIDGTIYSHKTHQIPSSTMNTLHQLQNNGHQVFICTGRCMPSIPDEYFQLPVDGLILGCGSHIIYHNETIYTKTLPKEDLVLLLDLLVENKVGFMLEGISRNYCYLEGLEMLRKFERDRLNLDVSDEEIDLILEKHYVLNYDKFIESDLDKCLKLTFYTHNEKIADILNHTPSSFQYYIVDDPSFKMYSGEITLKGVSKASGIDEILKYLQSSLLSTIAIGDGQNDLDMIEHAFIGIAMGNACDELKEKADYITNNIDEEGFENAFKHFQLIG